MPSPLREFATFARANKRLFLVPLVVVLVVVAVAVLLASGGGSPFGYELF